MKKYRFLIFSVILVCLLLSGCFCRHQPVQATCTTPVTCSLCGRTEGEPLGHNWREANCTVPKICLYCGTMEGDALGHSWVESSDSKRCTERLSVPFDAISRNMPS